MPAIGLEKLAHSPQILLRETTNSGLLSLNIIGQRRDCASAPPVLCDSVADVFTNLPVEIDQSCVDGLERPSLGFLYEAHDLFEGGFDRLVRFYGLESSKVLSLVLHLENQ